MSIDDHGLWNGIEIAPKGSINFETHLSKIGFDK
jgi:hypothetical protein